MNESVSGTTEPIFFHPDLFVIPDGREKPYLLGYQCSDCGKTWFPKVDRCPDCWVETTQIKLSRVGHLYSYSLVHIGQKGIKTPYIVGFVDLPENVRIFAQIHAAPEKLKVGMELEVSDGIIRIDNNNNPVLSYVFKAID